MLTVTDMWFRGMSISLADCFVSTVGASWLTWGLVKGAEFTGKAIHKGASKLREHTTPEDRPAHVSPNVTKGLHVAKQATGGAVKVSQFLGKKAITSPMVALRSWCLTFTFSHLADAIIQSDLQEVQGHFPKASRVKCLDQGNNVICMAGNQTGNLLITNLGVLLSDSLWVVLVYVVAVDGVCTVAGHVGRELAPHVKRHGNKLIPESLKKDKEGRSNIDGAMVVAASGVQGTHLGLAWLEAWSACSRDEREGDWLLLTTGCTTCSFVFLVEY